MAPEGLLRIMLDSQKTYYGIFTFRQFRTDRISIKFESSPVPDFNAELAHVVTGKLPGLIISNDDV
jgi:hypothetical protein